ncbi:hypothetical protein M885DRAFT_613725 [Pelagophyceae sp. CCMP2097]|nr:hypothetical protein M885DRAFT_613725 [Pelagophyceae sp. CCMP2097]
MSVPAAAPAVSRAVEVRPTVNGGAEPVLDVFELSDLLAPILRLAASTNALRVTKHVARAARAVAPAVRRLILEDRWKGRILKGTAILEGHTSNIWCCAFSPDGKRIRAIRALAEAEQDSMTKELDYFGLEVAVFGLRPWVDGATFRLGPTLSARRTTEVLDTRTMAFTVGPSMLTARYCHAAVQMDGNRSLVVGGGNADNEDLNTTEIFQLSTLTFTPVPGMQSARSGCSAVALDARRILVVGGHNVMSCLSTTENFSLDTMAFTPGPTIAAPRAGCAAIALDERRIMIAGGSSGSDSLITTEVLDIRTMAFTPGLSTDLARCYCTAVQIDTGYVLVIGVEDSSDMALATTELLDVATMAFEPGPAMQTGRSCIAAIHLDAAEEGPRILVLGGEQSTMETATVDALEHAFDAEIAQLASDRRALEDDRAAFIRETEDKVSRDEEEKERIKAAAPPPDELVKLNVGGARFETSRAVLTKVEDSMLGRMFGRCDAMLQPDPDDGSIFIDRNGERFRLILDFLRGDPPDGTRMERAIRALPEAAQGALVQELDYFGLEVAVFGLRPWTDGATFRPGPAMSAARVYCSAVAAGVRVIVFGGLLDRSASSTTEVLDMQTMAFAAGPDMLTARYCHAAVQMDGNRLLVVGGRDGDGEDLNTTEIFQLASLTFTPGPNMQILVVGGYDGESKLSTTEIFSLDTMAFMPGPTMAAPREGCAAVTLDEHRIMVTGGSSGSGSLITTEVLDVRTMAFTPGPAMASARCYCVALQVDAERVLIIGGQSSSTTLATTELLDVATMAFEPGPTMQTARSSIVAVRLDTAEEGPKILVFGGNQSSTEVLAVDAFTGVPATRTLR